MRRSLIALLPCLLGFAAAGEGDPFGFLPDGGRGLFARAFPDHAAQEAALAETRGEADWAAALVGAGLTDRERATLAAYLARIAPQEGGADPVATLPPDGRDMAVAQCQSCHSLFSGYLMQRRDRQGWLAVFASPFHAAIPLAPGARAIFADYLAYAGAVDPTALPPDGRDMTLERCQSCHIVTVVVTQARTREAWLGTMAKPSHVGVPLSEAERGQLADYLAVNAGIPIDAVPPELRAGGASY